MRARSTALLGIASLLVIGPVADRRARRRGRRGWCPTSAEPRSLLGSYLAGRLARGQNDMPAAATYYGKALEHDPDNEVLVEYAFQMEASEGNWPRVEELARELVSRSPRSGRRVHSSGLAAFKAGRYQEAEEQFRRRADPPIGELTSALARAWIYQAQNKTQEALAVLDAQRLPDWASYFLRYHRALIADVAGRSADAAQPTSAWPRHERTLRIALAYARQARQRRRHATGAEHAQRQTRAGQGRAASLRARACWRRSRPASGRSC